MKKLVLILLFLVCKLATAYRQCPKGQVKVCDTNCNRKCINYQYGNSTYCPHVTCVTTSCMCDPSQGYFLDQNTNRCVQGRMCSVPQPGAPNQRCPYGQTLGCGNNCGRTCYDYFKPSPHSACPRDACNPKALSCQCDRDKGFYYSFYRRQCVPYTECLRERRTHCSTCGHQGK